MGEVWGEEAEGAVQDSAFSFFLLFFRKEGARNFFFFFEGDLDGEPSGDTGPLVTDSFLSFAVSVSALVVIWLIPLLRASSTFCSSSFPFSTTAAGRPVVSVAAGSAGAGLPFVFFPSFQKRGKRMHDN